MPGNTSLQDLATALQQQASGNPQLPLSTTNITANSFKWALQAMGVTSLVVQINNPTQQITYTSANETLQIQGTCTLYSGSLTLTVSLTGSDVSTATCNVGGTYATFTLSQILSNKLVPQDLISASTLPPNTLKNIILAVAAEASEFPIATFALSAGPDTGLPALNILPSLGISLKSWGFSLNRTVQQNGYVNIQFGITGTITFGGIEVTLTVLLPTGSLDFPNLWTLSFASGEGAKGLSITNLAKALGGTNLFELLPSGLTHLLSFRLKKLTVVYDATNSSVTSIYTDIGTEDWEVVSGFTIRQVGFKLTVKDPFGKGRTITVTIYGSFQIGADDAATKVLLDVFMTLPIGSSGNWLLQISGEIDNNNLTQVYTALPGSNGNPLPALPEGLNVQQIKLEYLNVTFNPTSLTLPEVSFSVTSQLSFPIVPKWLTVSNPYAAFDITNPLISANRTLTGKAGGYITINDWLTLNLDASKPAADSGWIFTGKMLPGEKIPIMDMVRIFLAELNITSLPQWVEQAQLNIRDVEASIETPAVGAADQTNKYSIKGAVDWSVNINTFVLPSLTATVDLSYQNSKTSGTIAVDAKLLGMDFKVGYQFGAPATTVFLQWEDIVCNYVSSADNDTISVVFGDKSLGDIVTDLMHSFDPDFKLTAPWNIINSINLNGLSLQYTRYASTSPNVGKDFIEIIYQNANALDFTFIKFSKITLTKDNTGVFLGFEGSFLGIPITSTDPNTKALAGKGSDVTSMPGVPGAGDKMFDLQYLGLGQHVSLYPYKDLTTVEEATTALQNVFQPPVKPQPGKPPILPIPPKPTTPPQQSILIFDNNSNWLIGTQCTIMDTLDISIIFNDPNLYGLLIALHGDKAGIFKNLKFEILYKKVTDTVGVYQMQLQLPDEMRTLEFGEVSITLPIVGVDIYTNGSFKLDFGFPANLDFSRSLSVQVFPFVGAGGFYFAYLKDVPSKSVPTTTVGRFSPIIEFGIGLSLGVGKTINEGILSAGLSLTVIGIVEGVIASYNPNLPSYPGKGEYYYWVQGTFGIVGKIYGEINFAIISARLDITAYAYIRITIEAYNSIPIYFEAGVSVSLRVRINLGLFSIYISLSFSAKISASFVIGTDNRKNAPWNYIPGNAQSRKIRMMQLPANTTILWQPLLLSSGEKPTINLYFMPQLTVSGEQGKSQTGQYVGMLYMDCPDPNNPGAVTSFDSFVRASLLWSINAYINSGKTGTTLDALLQQAVSLDDLTVLYCYLAENSNSFSTIPYNSTDKNDIVHFLSNYFNINISYQKANSAVNITATVFPVLPSLQLNYSYNGMDSLLTDFSTYNMCDQGYLTTVQTQLKAMDVEYENGVDDSTDTICKDIPNTAPPAGTTLSLATFIFQDYFVMAAKAILQDAINAFKAYKHSLSLANGIDNIIQFYNQAPLNNNLDAVNLAVANKTVAITEGQNFNIAGITYQVTATDTFQTIVALYNKNLASKNAITVEQLGTTNNSNIVGLIATGTTINVAGYATYITTGNDSLTSIAANLVKTTATSAATVRQVIDSIQSQTVLTLFASIEIPQLTYTTGAQDSFDSIADTYGTTIAALAAVNGATTFQGTTITISGTTTDGEGNTINCLNNLLVQTIADSTCTADNVGKIAGMSSRFLLHGLRLPNPKDMNTLMPLYQLTGQQFAIPALKQNDNFSVLLNKDTATNWIMFNGSAAATQLPVVVDNNEISRITDVISLQLNPSATTQALTLYSVSKQTFTLKTDINWQYPGEIVLPIGTPLQQAVVVPTIWQLPETLMKQLYANTSGKDLQLVIKTITQDQPDTPFIRSNVQNYGWATLVNVAIKKITNGNAPIDSNAYDVQGTDDNGIVFLQRLLTYMNENGGDSIIDQIQLLYSPDNTGNASRKGLQSEANLQYIMSLVQANLSTETNPIKSGFQSKRFMAAPPRNTLNSFLDFIKLLWQCSIVRSGGYYLYYNTNNGDAGLPGYLFNDDGIANISLLITYTKDVPTEGFINNVVIADTIDTDKTTVYVESELLTTKTAIVPPGNAGVSLSRTNPGTYTPINPYPIPANAASQANDMIYLSTQFNLMGYNLMAGTGFKAAPLNMMPIGAADSVNDEDIKTLAAVPEWDDTSNWNYETMLPVYVYAANKIQPSDPNFPSADNDPYSGIGGTAVIQLNWQDMFGNIITTPLSQSANAVNAPVGYTDMLYNLSKWPNVTSSYLFEIDPPATTNLHVTLDFDESRYTGSDKLQKAKIDSAIYSTIYYQLLQPDVQVTMETTLNADTNNPKGAPVAIDKTQLINYAGTIYKYLQTIIDPKLPPVTITDPGFDFTVSPTNADDIFELSVQFTIQRTANIDPDFKDVNGVTSVDCPIDPSTALATVSKTAGATDDDGHLSLQNFAKKFEATFKDTPTTGIILKIATGITQEEVNSQSNDNKIWVVRFDTTGQHGINFTVDQTSQYFYSPIPLSTSLQTYTNVPINAYTTGTPFKIDPKTAMPKTFAAVDLDSWGGLCLNAIDELLSPAYAVPAFIIDNGVTLQSILDSKEKLANAITGTVDTIIEPGVNDPDNSCISNAQEVFRQQLLIQLSNTYSIDAIVQNPVAISSPYTNSNVQPQNKGPYNPMLYGQMFGSDGAAVAARLNANDNSDPSDEYSLSTAKIPMGNGKSWLNYVFCAKEAAKSSSYQFGNMACQVSHIEHQIQDVTGIKGYKASSWLNFVVALDASFGQAGPVNIPIPLRSYPTPPSIITQQSLYSANGQLPAYTTMETAKQWDFNFVYKQQEAAQDIINVQVEFNLDQQGLLKGQGGNGQSQLPEALAQFISVYPAIRQDFLAYLSKINAKTDKQSPDFLNAQIALQAFAAIANDIATEWCGWNQVNPIEQNKDAKKISLKTAILPLSVVVNYVINEVESVSGDQDSDLWVVITPDAANNTNIPFPAISIGAYQTQPVKGQVNTFRFLDTTSGKYLSYANRGVDNTRQLDFTPLNILDWQNSWAGIFITRNKDLVKSGNVWLTTNPLFIYQTPLVKFYNQLNPLLTCNEGIDVASINNTGKPQAQYMAVHIRNLYTALLQSLSNSSQVIKTECLYAYNLNGQDMYNQVELPVILVPPGGVDPDSDLNIGSAPPYCPQPDSGFACKVATTLLGWYNSQTPNTNNASFNFRIVVYDAYNNQLPVLKLNYVTLDIGYITDITT
jgi:LysM repeat protein